MKTFILLLLLSFSAFAGGGHHHEGEQGEQGIQGEAGPQGIQGVAGTNGADGVNGLNGSHGTNGLPASASGQALSNAIGQIDCDHGTQKWQGGVGIGIYDIETAIAGGVCKRFKDTLIKTTFGSENGKFGGGIGVMWHFN